MSADRAALVASPLAMDVATGLTHNPKELSPKYFYDATGSALFEEITRLPEYYLTQTEHTILARYSREILASAANGCGSADGGSKADLTILELGAGSAAKTLVLLRELCRLQSTVRFIPIDVSHSALEEAVANIGNSLPEVRVRPELRDYTESLAGIEQIDGRKLVLYIGSSIGNFEPFQAGALLRNVRNSFHDGDALLLGTDMSKSERVLLPAYDDELGITAAFNKNILARINRELQANFDLDSFTHRAIWNPGESRIEMHLESEKDQQVEIGAINLNVGFSRGETIHTENSYKFTMNMIQAIANNAGFQLEKTWSDPRGWFTVHLLRV